MSATVGNFKVVRHRLSLIAQAAARADRKAAAVTVPTWAIFLTATALGSWALWIYLKADFTLTYADAIGHLNIARRMVDSVTPSFAQLGANWLPLPHLLMLPTIWNDTMWHTGLSGSIISVIAFALSTVYIHRTIYALTNNGLAALLGSALLATNANMLFMQATPMVEALTIFLILGSTFHLLRWTQDGSAFHLILSAAFVLAGTMTRYETWVLVPAGIVVVALASFQRHHSLRHVEGFTLTWGVLASYGILLWLLYNQVIFGDVLYFSTGGGSATAFADVAEAEGLLPTKYDPVESTSAYGWTVIDNLGLPLVLAGAAGSLVLLGSRQSLPIKLAALLPTSLFIFHVASLTAGQSVLSTPHSFPSSFHNVRYGLLMLPVAVIAASYLTRPLRSIGLLLLCAALVPQLLALPGLMQGPTVVESQVKAYPPQAGVIPLAPELAGIWVDSNLPILRGDQQITATEAAVQAAIYQPPVDEAADWINDHAPEGKILISAQANNAAAFMFHSGLPLSRFISEANKPFFPEELDSPGQHAQWMVYQPHETFDALRPLAELGAPARFRLAFENGTFQIFERLDPSIDSDLLSGRSEGRLLNVLNREVPPPAPAPTLTATPAPTATATPAPAPTVLEAVALPDTGGEPPDGGGPDGLTWLEAIAAAAAALGAGALWLVRQRRRVREESR